MIVACFAGVALCGWQASFAPAYSHAQPCYSAAYLNCYDAQGQTYNPWVLVDNTMQAGGGQFPGVCAKAVTQAGSIKSGSTCLANTSGATAYLAASPTSLAYGYWGDGGCHCWPAFSFQIYARS